mmetsp:Transcript_38568/g.54275  ORF Transcript_38568/g.54275 Transcript_38568/m.54275 type:complete len:277 (+) Transcript_38568:102-932(+)
MTVKKDEEDPEKGKRPFPGPFYCPITNKIMKDPVVIPSGDSFERSAIIERGEVPESALYSNRALREIIDETTSMNGDSFRASLRRLDKSIRDGFKQLVEKSAVPSEEYRPLPEAFYGPITSELIHDPVIDPDGNTYERQAIIHWIHANKNSPITRNELTVDQLYDNSALGDLIDLEKGRSDQSIHPSIRRWKQQEPTAVQYDNNNNDDDNTNANANTQFPITQDEIEQRRRRVRRSYTACAVLLVVLVLLLYIPYLGWLLLALFIFSSGTDDDDDH